MYNEMVILKLVQAMSKLVQHPPPVFEEDIRAHFQHHAPRYCIPRWFTESIISFSVVFTILTPLFSRFASRLNKWLDVSDHYNNSHPLSPTTPSSFKEINGEGKKLWYLPFYFQTNWCIILCFWLVAELALPEFPLIPASKGFCLTLKKTLSFFKEVISSAGIISSETEESQSESQVALPTCSSTS